MPEHAPEVRASARRWTWPALYLAWASVSIAASLALAGLTAESVTRLLVLAFLLVQVVLRDRLSRAFRSLVPRARFVVLGSLLAAIVEGFHTSRRFSRRAKNGRSPDDGIRSGPCRRSW